MGHPREFGGGRRRLPEALRRRRLLAVILGVIALSAALSLLFELGGGRRPGPLPHRHLREPLGGRSHRVTAWTLGDSESLEAALAAQAVDEIDFDWYLSHPDGSVTSEGEDLGLVARARERGVAVFATVTNRTGAHDPFSRAVAHAIMSSEEACERYARSLLRLVEDKGYDGIDLDWEELQASDRDSFSTLVERLAAVLHENGRFISLAVYPKSFEPGRWGSQQAQDYRRLGAAVDELKLMTYGHSGPWSKPGPQAPTAWVDQVLTFAESVVDPHKLVMGVPFFGFDWHGGAATAVTARQAAAAARRHAAGVRRDRSSGEARLTYHDERRVRHVVYFQDATALGIKLRLLTDRHPQVAGVAFWLMGQELPSFWRVVQRRLR